MEVWKIILKNLYKVGEVDEIRLEKAVSKGFITMDEKQEIVSQ